MKVWFLLVIITSVTAREHVPYTRRRHVGPMGPPQHYTPQHVKKYYQRPPRNPPPKSRPIPVHMPLHHKIPMGVPPSFNARPIEAPIRNFWKSTQTSFVAPYEKHRQQIAPNEVFSYPAPDYHLQNNTIPTQIFPIKQVGEKGPIHTIPAPNLTPADRPAHIQEVKHFVPQNEFVQPETTFVQVQKSHEYQVTEPPELGKQNLNNNYYQYLHLDIKPNAEQSQSSQESIEDEIVPNEDFYDPKFFDQSIVQEIPQNVPNYNLWVLDQPKLANPDQTFEHHIRQGQVISEDLVANDEILQSEYKINSPSASDRSSLDSEFVQKYFDQKEGEEVNNVEVKDEKCKDCTAEIKDLYTSLPNKEVADTLASLQSAGKINSNLMQIVSDEEKGIYVPDSSEDYQQFDDYEEEERKDEAFGERLKPKRN